MRGLGENESDSMIVAGRREGCRARGRLKTTCGRTFEKARSTSGNVAKQ